MKRAMLLERRRFVEEPEKTLTMLEALLLAVEALQECGGERMDQAARMLDRKAMKLRAREEASIRLPEFCLCGNARAKGRHFCVSCHGEIPLRMWMAYHTARSLKEADRAFAEIRQFVRSQRGGRR